MYHHQSMEIYLSGYWLSPIVFVSRYNSDCSFKPELFSVAWKVAVELGQPSRTSGKNTYPYSFLGGMRVSHRSNPTQPHAQVLECR